MQWSFRYENQNAESMPTESLAVASHCIKPYVCRLLAHLNTQGKSLYPSNNFPLLL